MHFVRKKVHHITGRRLFTISSVPLQAYTILSPHSCPHCAICRKAKEKEMFTWNSSLRISISLGELSNERERGKCNESLYACMPAICFISNWVALKYSSEFPSLTLQLKAAKYRSNGNIEIVQGSCECEVQLNQRVACMRFSHSPSKMGRRRRRNTTHHIRYTNIFWGQSCFADTFNLFRMKMPKIFRQ